MRQDPERALHGPATNDAPEAASQAAGLKRGTAPTHAYAHWGTGPLPAGCPNGTLPLLRSADERSIPKLVSWGSRAPVVADLATPESEAFVLAPPAAIHLIHPTLVPRFVSVIPIRYSACASSPKVGAGCVRSASRICGGGRERSRSLTPTGPAARADRCDLLKTGRPAPTIGPQAV